MYSKELSERKAVLEAIIGKITRELPAMPPGNLRIQKKGIYTQYFHVTGKEDSHGNFIKADNKELVTKLAQKSYYEKLLREAKKEHKAITAYLRGTAGNSPEDVFSGMNEYRKKLIEPLLISDEEYVKRWEESPYERNPYHPEECTQPTEKGDLVRSKTEARIADMYYALGIPYRYEAAVKLKNGKTKYPDFTLLKLPERIEYYHEHLGIMDDETYRFNNLVKLSEYAESKIFIGKNLILTFDTDYAPLNIKLLRSNLKEIFRKETC